MKIKKYIKEILDKIYEDFMNNDAITTLLNNDLQTIINQYLSNKNYILIKIGHLSLSNKSEILENNKKMRISM